MSATIVCCRAASARLCLRSVPRQGRLHCTRLGAPTPFLRTFTASTRWCEKRYTKDHEWVEFKDGSKTEATVGISTYAANALGDVVYVELPTVGTEVGKDETMGAVESVKSASDIMTPVSGKIVEVNKVLEEKPGTINKSPEQEGWLARIAVSAPEEFDELMDEAGYEKFTEEAGSS